MEKLGISSSKKHKLILDTNIFNWVLDKKLHLNDFPVGSEFYATDRQYDELNSTSDSRRRAQLLDIFFQINPSSLPTESFILGYSRIGKAKIGDGDLYCQILDSLNRIKLKESNINDSLISEVAIIHNIELVTMDEDLKKVHTQYGGIIYDGFAH